MATGIQERQPWTVPGIGPGRQDYTGETAKSRQIFGTILDVNETVFWFFLIAMQNDGPAIFTRPPITVAEGWVDVPEVSTGLSPYPVPAGYDYVLKEIWLSFTQPCSMELFQGGAYNDASCRLEADSYPGTPINQFQTGWTRSLLEDITQPSVARVRVRNEGVADMEGKIWLLGFMKPSPYIWW
jgi:hypothetical protein